MDVLDAFTFWLLWIILVSVHVQVVSYTFSLVLDTYVGRNFLVTLRIGNSRLLKGLALNSYSSTHTQTLQYFSFLLSNLGGF